MTSLLLRVPVLVFLFGASFSEFRRDPATSGFEPTAEGEADVTVVGNVRQGQTAEGLANVLVAFRREGQAAVAAATTSDDSGSYRLTVAPGRYRISASKPGYVDWRPGSSERRVDITGDAGNSVPPLELSPGAVVEGAVTDEEGAPLPGVLVTVHRKEFSARYFGFVLASTPTGRAVSDDRGLFRIFGLPTGEYYVAYNRQFALPGSLSTALATGAAKAKAPETLEHLVGDVPWYYPGFQSPAEASSLQLRAGETMRGIDARIAFVAVESVKGVVLRAGGEPASLAKVRMAYTLPGADNWVAGHLLAVAGLQTTSQGEFTTMPVPPGTYEVTAVEVRPEDQGSSTWWAQETVVVSPGVQPVVTLNLRASSGVTGYVKLDGRPAESGIGLTLSAIRRSTPAGLPTVYRTTALDGGSFVIADVLPGTYRVSARGLNGDTLAVQAVRRGTNDDLDALLEVEGQAPTETTLVLSTTFTELLGEVLLDDRQVAANVPIVIYSNDRTGWRPHSRRVSFTSTDSQGEFFFRGLPPGEYWLATLPSQPIGNYMSPAALDALRDSAVQIPLGSSRSAVTLCAAEGKVTSCSKSAVSPSRNR